MTRGDLRRILAWIDAHPGYTLAEREAAIQAILAPPEPTPAPSKPRPAGGAYTAVDDPSIPSTYDLAHARRSRA